MKFIKTLAIVGILATVSTASIAGLFTEQSETPVVTSNTIDILQSKGWVIPAETEYTILNLQDAIEKLTKEGWVIPEELLELFKYQLSNVNN